MQLGEIIYKYRKEKGFSMDEFSDKSGISKAYISMLEKGKHPKTGKPITPSLETIFAVAKGMRIETNDLLAMLDAYQEVKVPSSPVEVENEDAKFLLDKLPTMTDTQAKKLRALYEVIENE